MSFGEAPDISIALHNTDALRSGGPFSLVSAVIEQGIQAPLVPLSAVPFNVVFGDGSTRASWWSRRSSASS